jgi:hypothetical protein
MDIIVGGVERFPFVGSKNANIGLIEFLFRTNVSFLRENV